MHVGSDMKKFLKIAMIFSSSTLVLLVLFGLIFRATLYWTLPISPGEPFGLADILELFIYFTILGMAGLLILFALLMLTVPAWRNIRLAIIALIVSLIMPPLYFMLHAVVPRLL